MAEKTYTQDEVCASSLEYFGGDEIAASVFCNKYALSKDNTWYEPTPESMHRRIASEFSRIESNYDNPVSYDEIYKRLSTWEIVPQGSPMSAIGNNLQIQSLSNCFVVSSPYDSYAGIMATDEQLVQIMKRRGGCGVNISTIRPRGLSTTNAARTTDGILVFMKRYSNTTREVAQGGRRGALMLSLNCFHTQIEDFIDVKRNKTVVTGANISIMWTDEFMKSVADDSKVTLRWPVDASEENVVVKNIVNARNIFDKFVYSNWEADEPGALFWDTILRKSISDRYGGKYKTVCTNPCSEIPMPADDSCRLLVLNAAKFVRNKWTKNAYFDFDAFAKSVMIAQRLLDDLIDLEIESVQKIIDKVKSDPEPEEVKSRELALWYRIKDMAIECRRTGLGITALGDVIAMLGHRYGDESSIELTSKIYRQLAVSSWKSSCIMAKERGTFPIYDSEVEKGHEYIEFILSLDDELRSLHEKYGRRNISITTTAPVGSTSILTQTTSGIEPTVYISYTRNVKVTEGSSMTVDFIDEQGDKWHQFPMYHPGFKDWVESTGHTFEDVEKSPYWGSTVNDIDWQNSIRLQAEAQKYVDHAISKTCNFPAEATVEQIRDAYILAWKLGCKGITIYREGTRKGIYTSSQQSSSDKKDKKVARQTQVIVDSHAPKRPKELNCSIHKVTVKGESWVILVGYFDGRPYEVFGGLAKFVEIPKKYKMGVLIKNGRVDGVSTYNLVIKTGEDEDDTITFKNIVDVFENPAYGAWTRTVSLALRHGVPIQYIVEQLQKDKLSEMQSFSRVLSRVLKNYIKDGTESTIELTHSRPDGKGRCSAKFVYLGGCPTCLVCGHSACS